MIVIVIIGVVYTLAITQLKDFSAEEVKPSLKTLKEYLVSLVGEGESAQMLCLDDCSECTIYVDGEKTVEIENFFDAEITLYRYDFLQGVVEQQEAVYFNEDGVQEHVCFSFEVDRDGVSDQVIALYKEKVYDFTPYFTPTQLYKSLDDLVDAKEKKAQEVMQ